MTTTCSRRSPARQRLPRLLGLPVLLVLALDACTSMSGLDGSSSYACKAPEGVTCDSVAGTYANSVQDNLPRRHSRAISARPAASGAEGARAAALGEAGSTEHPPAKVTTAAARPPLDLPLRSPARVLRLWFKPWEDADHDLYDQGYVYVQVDGGRWLIEHAQRQIRDAHAPLRPPTRSAGPAVDSKAAQALTLPRGPMSPVSPMLRPDAD